MDGGEEHGKQPITIAVIGDSLADKSMPASYVSPLAAELRQRGWHISIDNLGRAGATTAYAPHVAKEMQAAQAWPDVAIIALGGNDIGDEPESIKDNLSQAISMLKNNGVQVVLSGMKAPSWLSDDYRDAFDAIYPSLAEDHGIVLDPLINETLIRDPEGQSFKEIFNQDLMDDTVHPNSKGAALIADDLLAEVETVLARVEEKEHSPNAAADEKAAAQPNTPPSP